MNWRLLAKDIMEFNRGSLSYRLDKVAGRKWQRAVEYGRRSLIRFRDVRRIPVIINCRDRLSCLQTLVEWLEAAEMTNIVLLDNNSSYPPLLEFYAQSKYPVVRLGNNLGFQALWRSGLYKKYRYDYYIYTDPDVVPIAECPDDVVEHFLSILWSHPDIQKVGIGLKVDDLPDCYAPKQEVLNWESSFWRVEISPDVWDARVDTTFALYRPLVKGGAWLNACRTGYPYLARHLPWYEDSSHPTEELLYYQAHLQSPVHWSSKQSAGDAV